MKRILVTGGSGLVGKSLQQIMKDAIYISSKDYDLTDIQQVEQMYLDMLPDLRYNKARLKEFSTEQKHKMENIFDAKAR